MLTLARELWILRDRQQTLEAVLDARGLVERDVIDRYEPTDVEAARSDRECRAFVDALVADLGVPIPAGDAGGPSSPPVSPPAPEAG